MNNNSKEGHYYAGEAKGEVIIIIEVVAIGATREQYGPAEDDEARRGVCQDTSHEEERKERDDHHEMILIRQVDEKNMHT